MYDIVRRQLRPPLRDRRGPSASTSTARRSWTCGAARPTPLRDAPGPRTPSRSSSPPRRRSPPPAPCTSADRGALDLGRARLGLLAGVRKTPHLRTLAAHPPGRTGRPGPSDHARPRPLAWQPMITALEAQRPFWEPGTESGYHARTFGFLVGEVVRRVSGRSLGTYLREEIAGPLGLDFWIGLPASEHHRAARIVSPKIDMSVDPATLPEALRPYFDPTSLTMRASMAVTPFLDHNDPAELAAEFPRRTAPAPPGGWRASTPPCSTAGSSAPEPLAHGDDRAGQRGRQGAARAGQDRPGVRSPDPGPVLAQPDGVRASQVTAARWASPTRPAAWPSATS